MEESGKSENFSRSEKSRGIFKKSGKIFDIAKVREFCFPVYSYLQDFEIHFLSEKTKSMLQSKQSDQFDTLRLIHVVVVVSGFRCERFLPNYFFLFSLSRGKRLHEIEEKNIDGLQKKLKRM